MLVWPKKQYAWVNNVERSYSAEAGDKGAGENMHTHTHTNTHSCGISQKDYERFIKCFPFKQAWQQILGKARVTALAFGYGLIFKLGARWIESERYQSSLY